MSKIKISAVSYLNSKPFIYGLQHSSLKEEIDLCLDMPSMCAQKLLKNEVDIGLVPVAILPEMKQYFVLTDYCIGALGKVASVVLFSDVPLDAIETVSLDYQSRSSVLLVKILAKKFWKINPAYVNATEGYEKDVEGTSAVVVIGDRAIQLIGKYKYAYDLAGEWTSYTGLPFVFACWVANKKLPEDFIQRFSDAVKFGVAHKMQAIAELELKTPATFNIQEYVERNISYEFDDDKRKGMDLFLSLMKELD